MAAELPPSDDAGSSHPLVRLEPWRDAWDADDPDSNFKSQVALYSALEPLATLRALSERTRIPVGALCRYVLARWATGGSEGLLELGPSTVGRMWEACEAAEREGTDAARLRAYEQLRAMLGWLRAGLD